MEPAVAARACCAYGAYDGLLTGYAPSGRRQSMASLPPAKGKHVACPSTVGYVLAGCEPLVVRVEGGCAPRVVR